VCVCIYMYTWTDTNRNRNSDRCRDADRDRRRQRVWCCVTVCLRACVYEKERESIPSNIVRRSLPAKSYLNLCVSVQASCESFLRGEHRKYIPIYIYMISHALDTWAGSLRKLFLYSTEYLYLTLVRREK
jgi:hypothetical protein